MMRNTSNDNVNNNTDHEVKDGNAQNTICNRRIEHTTTATVVNNISITEFTLDIRPGKQNSVINVSKVHRNIFEAIKQIDGTAMIITQDNIRITNSNTFPTDKVHTISFSEQRL